MSKGWTFLKHLWALVLPYFKSSGGKWALAFFAFLVGLSFVIVELSVRINYWNNRFFTALQEKNADAFWKEMGVFGYLAAIFITIAVLRYVLQQVFEIRWRTWLTNHFIDRWTTSDAYYKMQMTHRATDNPDQRISEDLRRFVELTLALSLSFISNGATLVSFAFVLWSLSAPIETFNVNGTEITIPGLLFWIALLYSIGITWVLHLIGRPLVRLNFERERVEADFRFDLVRVRENAEAIALYDGSMVERGRLKDRFERVRQNFMEIVKRQKYLVAVQAFFDQATVPLPYLLMAPIYFIGKIPFGHMTQTASAFSQVQNAFSWFANLYPTLAEWVAVVQRLTGFIEVLEAAERETCAARRVTELGNRDWVLEGVSIRLPDGRHLTDADLSFKAGESVLITGPSGSGKSTLFRILADIWPYAEGLITVPQDGDKTLFLPQQPYVPVGTLRAAVSYPMAEGTIPDAMLAEALYDVGLGDLAGRLDEEGHWQMRLSGGELQRLAIARALVLAPKWLFLDEATSAMDEAMEARLYDLIRRRLPDATLVSIGHRSSLKAFHDREIAFGAAT
ncbi:ABC transporter ATP-binding protein/permease [Zavarzinia compransoris]|uniref:ABC transporter ATP-binding protein/permease n=1 Tax=Zavarzinia marina TaxID=2911065 RepID=UPI001F3888D0|nr:ABC transporter ATP-binding protein/permease [Zavarzinia marina]MCF4164371.1 ABC transporter ATP-binding protein/permease [Zavarzinia marina]